MKIDCDLKYPLIRSNRKSCAIKINANGDVTIHAPRNIPLSIIEIFVKQKNDWIIKNRQKILLAKSSSTSARKLSDEEIRYLIDDAKRLIPPRVEHFANEMGVTLGRITIRTQRTRWGSCSNKKNLNFNCLLMLAPEDVLDYVIVHELCHLKEMNHSNRFWAEVKRVLPDYEMSYSWLRKHGRELMEQLPEK